MKQILKLVCFILVPVSIVSCDSSKEKAIKDGISDRENKKGHTVISFSIDREVDRSGVTTVYYQANCNQVGESDPSKVFNLSDSLRLWKTGDGVYQVN